MERGQNEVEDALFEVEDTHFKVEDGVFEVECPINEMEEVPVLIEMRRTSW